MKTHPAFSIVILWALSLSTASPGSFAWKNPPEKEVLPNGLTLVYEKDASSAITVVLFLLKGGQLAEPPGKEGLSYLTTRLMVEIPDQGKIQEMMGQATRLSMSCRPDYSFILISCLSEYFEDALHLVSSIMGDPLFSGLRISRIQESMLYQRKAQEDEPINTAHSLLMKAFYAGTPYAGSIYGNKESLEAIKKKDIEDLYKAVYHSENATAIVITDLEKSAVKDFLEKSFEKIPKGEPQQLPTDFSFQVPGTRKILEEKDSRQSLVCISYPLEPTTPKNYTLSYLVETLLGKGPESKLWPLRSKEKLAYNVNARTHYMKQGGICEAYLETDTAKKETAFISLKEILYSLYEKGVTEEELQMTKAYARASFLREHETKEMRALLHADFAALDLGSAFLEKFYLEVDTITLEEMNRYLKNTLDPEKAVEVIVGPGTQTSQQKE